MEKTNGAIENLKTSIELLVQYFNSVSTPNSKVASIELNDSNESAFVQIENEFRYWAGASFNSSEESEIENLPTSCSPDEFWVTIKRRMKSTQLVVDLGSGVRPNLFLGQKTTICVELFKPYLEYLRNTHPGENIITIEEDVLSFLKRQSSRSIETLVVTDLIEHLTKSDGRALIGEIERTVIGQALIVTPRGFMPQHVGDVDDEGWGFIGNTLQNHISGWDFDDFPGWEVMSSENYYTEVNHPEGVIACVYAPNKSKVKEFHIVIEHFTDEKVMVGLATQLFELIKFYLLKKDYCSIIFTLPLAFSPKSNRIFPKLVMPDTDTQYASFNWEVNNLFELNPTGKAEFVPGTVSNIIKNTSAENLIILCEKDESSIKYKEIVQQKYSKLKLDDEFLFQLRMCFESNGNDSKKEFLNLINGYEEK